MLDLIELVHGTDRRGAVEWAKDYLGVNSERDNKRPVVNKEVNQAAMMHRNVSYSSPDEDRAKRRAAAASIWGASGPLFGPALNYLRARGLDAKYAGSELRFHPGLSHPSGGTFPAIVARVTGSDGKGCGIWRTYLKADGSGKAPVENPKLGLGDAVGGAVRLGGMWSNIAIAEGIETALAVRALMPNPPAIPVWAALSTSGLRGFVVPEGVEKITIYADNDAPKIRNGELKESPGMAAARALESRLYGVERVTGTEPFVRAVITPPPGQDWLDVLNAEQRTAA